MFVVAPANVGMGLWTSVTRTPTAAVLALAWGVMFCCLVAAIVAERRDRLDLSSNLIVGGILLTILADGLYSVPLHSMMAIGIGTLTAYVVALTVSSKELHNAWLGVFLIHYMATLLLRSWLNPISGISHFGEILPLLVMGPVVLVVFTRVVPGDL